MIWENICIFVKNVSLLRNRIMNDYIKVDFTLEPINEIEADILDALLCEIGFESFESTETGVWAYIKKELFQKDLINEAVSQYDFTSKITWNDEFIEGRDWNEEWEKNFFKPMVIANRCVIHSTFHTDYPKLEYDITIDPKMAFGTGHHSTTNLIVTELLSMNLGNQKIIDMGTGTGILSIVSVLHGAESAIGIEIDEAAYVNAVENIELNSVQDKISILHGDASILEQYEDGKFDIVLANINRNVILSDIEKYSRVLKSGGKMLLSGFYYNEIPMLIEKAKEYSLTKAYSKEDNNWALLVLNKL